MFSLLCEASLLKNFNLFYKTNFKILFNPLKIERSFERKRIHEGDEKEDAVRKSIDLCWLVAVNGKIINPSVFLSNSCFVLITLVEGKVIRSKTRTGWSTQTAEECS
jgi:hypothetical protein